MSTPAADDTDDFSRIVHATDFSTASEAAFAHGLRLALAVRGHFYLVHAENLDAGEDGDWAAFPGVRSTLVRWGLLPVDADPAAVADRLGLRITKADIPDARPTDGVLRVVDNNHCNFLVLATHAARGSPACCRARSPRPWRAGRRSRPCSCRSAARGFVDAATGTPRLRNILQPIAAGTTLARPPRWPCAWPTRSAAARPSCMRCM